MSKKQTTRRLEKLFEGLTPEETKPKQNVRRLEQTAPGKQSAMPKPKPAQGSSTPKMTGTLPAIDNQVAATASSSSARLALAFPMDAQKWATLEILDQNTSRAWDDEEKLLVKQVTDQLSLALENARLFQQTQKQAGELAILNEMGQELASRLDITGVCEAVYHHTSRLMDTNNFFISLYNAEEQIIQYAIIINDGTRFEPYARPIKKGLSDHVLSTGKPLFLPDHAPERMKDLDIELITIGDDRPPLCWLGVPLIVGSRILGVMAVQSVVQHNLYTEHHYELLITISNQSAIAIANAQLFQQTEQQANELAILNEMGRELSSELDIEASCATVQKYTTKLMDASDFFIALLDEKTQRLQFPYASAGGKRFDIPSRMMASGLTDHVLRTREPLFMPDNVEERGRQLGIDVMLVGNNKPSLCWMGVPLNIGERAIGVIVLQSTEKLRLFTADQFDLLKTIASQAAISLENARLFESEQRRSKELNALVELSRSVSENLELEDVYKSAYHIVSQLISTDSFYLQTYELETDSFTNDYAIDNGKRLPIEKFPATAGIGGRAIKDGKPFLINDLLDNLDPNATTVRIVNDSTNYAPTRSVIATPLIYSGSVIGAMSVQNLQPNFYTENDLRLLNTFADTIALGIQNARLFQAEQRRANELNTLVELSRLVSQNLNLEEVYATAYQIISKVMVTDAFFISIHEPGSNVFTNAYDMDRGIRLAPKNYPSNTGFTGHVLGLGDSYIAYDLQKEPGTFQHVDNIDEYELPRSVIAAPLRFSGQLVGVISAQSYKANTYSQTDLHLLESFADTIAIGIQNAKLFQQTELRAEEMSVLNDLGRALSTQLDVDQVLQETYKGVSRLMEAANFFIGLYDENTHIVTFPVNITQSEIDKEIVSLDADEGMTGYIFRGRAPLLIQNNVSKWLAEHDIKVIGQVPLSWLGVPLMVGNQFLGLIAVQSLTDENVYDEHDRDLLLAFANQAAIAIQNANLFKETKERNQQLAALNEIIGSASQFLDEKALLTTVLEKLLDTTNFDGGLITIFNETRGKLERVARIGMPTPSPADPAEGLDTSLCGYVYDTGELAVIDDFRKGAPIDVSSEIENGLLGYIGVPLEAKGKVLGTVCVFRKIAAPIPRETVALIQSVGRQVGFAIENAQLFRETQHRAEIERFASEISNIFASIDPLDVSTGINNALYKLGEFTNIDRAYMILLDPINHVLNYANEWHSEATAPLPESQNNIPEDQFPYLLSKLRENKILYTPHVEQLPKEAKTEMQRFLREGIQSNVCIPLFDRGVLIGWLGFDAIQKERAWSSEEQNLLRVTGETIVTALSRQQAAEALSKSEAELRALFNSMTDVIIVYDTEGRYVRIAPTNPNRLYKPIEDMVGKTIFEVLPPDTHEPFINAIRQAIKTAETIRLEYPLEIGENVFWFDASVSKLSENQVFWISRDITERKHSEEAIRRQNEYLATAAEVGRLVTSTLDLNLLFTRAVNLIRERFGFYHAAIFTIEETGFNAILREGTGDAGKEMRMRQHTLAVGSKSVIGKVTESGEPVIVNNTALDPTHRPNPLLPETRAEAGIPLRVSNRVIGALDIQAAQVDVFTPDSIVVLQILADQIAVAIDNARSYDLAQQAVKEMREADRLKSQFLANMSHELRTPLNSIIGFSRVILKGIDGPISELQQQDLSAIYNSGQHLLGLINDILDLSRIEAGKMELTFDEVNIGETINSVMSTIAGLVKDKPITIKKHYPQDLPPVRADAMRIRQVLLNLMSNAAKFTDEGDIVVEASVKTSPSGHPEIMIGVTDSGPGIAPEDQAKLFQPFSQVDSSPTRKTGGSGLGLSISQHLIQMHGGRIGLHSIVGKGSTFYFTLPVYRGKDTPTEAVNRVVLAIDDDPQVINLYERYLQPQGYQVVSLSDPSKAVERVRQLKPFAITLDIMMPGYDGWQVIKELKAREETRNVPVIICSIIEDEEKGFSLGAAEYLVKPVMEDDLLNALNRLNSDGSIREVLVIDDDPDDLRLISKILSNDGRYKALLEEGGKNGWTAIMTKPPHAIVLDLFMADLDGFTILERLREDEKYRQIPVIVVTGGDLTVEQQEQLTAFGQRLLQKGSLKENDLLSTLENALKRVTPQ